MPADHGNVDAKWDNIVSEVIFFYALKFPSPKIYMYV